MRNKRHRNQARQDRRFKARRAKEGNKILNTLLLDYCRVLDANVDDPEGEKVAQAFTTLNQKWRTYATGRFNAEGVAQFETEVKDIMKKFNDVIENEKKAKSIPGSEENGDSAAGVPAGDGGGSSEEGGDFLPDRRSEG